MKLLLVNPGTRRRRRLARVASRGFRHAGHATHKNPRRGQARARPKKRTLTKAQIRAGFGGAKARAAARRGRRRAGRVLRVRDRGTGRHRTVRGVRRGRARKNPHTRKQPMRVRLRRKHRLNPRKKKRARRALKAVRRRSRRRAKKNPRRRARRNPRRRARRNPRRSRRRARRNPRRRARRNPKGQPKLAVHKGKARRGSKRYRAIRRRARRGRQLTAGQAAYAAAAHGKRGGSALRRLAGKTLRRRSGASKGMRAVARAWRSAKVAQKLARGGKDLAYLKAAGLAGVPNPGLGSLKGLITLLPTAGAAVGGLAAIGFIGSKLGSLIQEKAALSGTLGAQLPAITTLVLSGIAYGVVRNVKPLAKFSLPVFLGGFIAAVVQAIANISLSGPAVGKDPTQPISESNPATATSMSLGRKLGLPIGDYTMTGDFTMTGDYTATGGTDDDPVYDELRGTDDDPVFDDLAGIFSGSNGGIFRGA